MRQSWKSGALALTLAAGAHLALFSLNWPTLPSEPAVEPAVTVELAAPAPRPADAESAPARQVVTTSGQSDHQTAGPTPAEPPPAQKPRAPAAPPAPAPARTAEPARGNTPARPTPVETETPDSQRARPAAVVQQAPSQPEEMAPATQTISLVSDNRGNRDATEAGNRAQGAGMDAEAVRSGYRHQLESHLNQYQRYPAGAQRKQQTGTVEVAFVIDRQGHLVSSELLSRTPFPLLNREALALLKRAVPFPPVPDTLTDDQLHWELPIHFRLN